MEEVFRIALQKMLVLFRLAIVASLAGYTLPVAAAAMHGDMGGTYCVSASTRVAVVDKQAHAEHRHGGAVQTSDSDNDQKPGKQRCCADFCVNAAITVEALQIGMSRSSLIVRHSDEPHLAGLGWSLHRPPNLRA